jgi:hypothetical protein
VSAPIPAQHVQRPSARPTFTTPPSPTMQSHNRGRAHCQLSRTASVSRSSDPSQGIQRINQTSNPQFDSRLVHTGKCKVIHSCSRTKAQIPTPRSGPYPVYTSATRLPLFPWWSTVGHCGALDLTAKTTTATVPWPRPRMPATHGRRHVAVLVGGSVAISVMEEMWVGTRSQARGLGARRQREIPDVGVDGRACV